MLLIALRHAGAKGPIDAWSASRNTAVVQSKRDRRQYAAVNHQSGGLHTPS